MWQILLKKGPVRDLLINAELARVTPEEIARHFVMFLRVQESRVVADSGS
jgi:hypothetical protein